MCMRFAPKFDISLCLIVMLSFSSEVQKPYPKYLHMIVILRCWRILLVLERKWPTSTDYSMLPAQIMRINQINQATISLKLFSCVNNFTHLIKTFPKQSLVFSFFFSFFVICSLTKANWLIDLTGDKLDDDRLIHWLNTIQYICCSRRLAGCWIIRLVRFHLLGWLTNWLSDWLSNWMSEKLKASLTDRPTDKLKDSWLTTDWFFASLSHVRFIYLNLVGSLFISP